MTDLHAIPLNKLVASSSNVRKTAGADTALAELAASIAAHGLLQTLVVRKSSRGRYEVVAGGRRLAALQSLAESGAIRSSHLVKCTLIDDDADATEISLAENAVREQMHPADEFEAFLALSGQGAPAHEIAARFGVTATVVLQRLKLARVSPALMQAYREGRTTLDCLMAFSVTDDHAAQEALWDHASHWLLDDPRQIRQALTKDSITAADRRVKFVTVKAYEKAGGPVRRDLFSNDEDGVYIEDVALLETLVARKLRKTAKAVAREGWKWTELQPQFDHADWRHCERVHPEALPLSEEDAAELAGLEQEADAFYDVDGELDDDQQARFQTIADRIAELEDRAVNWSGEAKARAGVVISLGYDGAPEIRRGFVKPEDQPAGVCDDPETSGDGAPPAAGRGGLPATLTENLTRHRTAALSAALCERPDVAVAALVHTLACAIFLGRRSGTCLQISAAKTSLRSLEGTRACLALQHARDSWGERLPGTSEGLWSWCLEQPQAVLLDLLAFCAADTVDAVQAKGDNPKGDRLSHAQALSAALALDMTAWFTPTAENYFGRIGKAGIIEALQDAGKQVAPAWPKARKSELAAIAERELATSGWLPEPLRQTA